MTCTTDLARFPCKSCHSVRWCSTPIYYSTRVRACRHDTACLLVPTRAEPFAASLVLRRSGSCSAILRLHGITRWAIRRVVKTWWTSCASHYTHNIRAPRALRHDWRVHMLTGRASPSIHFTPLNIEAEVSRRQSTLDNTPKAHPPLNRLYRRHKC